MSWSGVPVGALAGAILVGGLALAIAARRGRRQLFGTAVAVLALAALALAPTPGPSDTSRLLLTEGADLDRLAEGGGLHPSRAVYAIGGNPAWPRWVEALADIGPLLRTSDAGGFGAGGSLVVAGYGLDPWDVERLMDAAAMEEGPRRTELVRAGVPAPAPGIRQVAWRRDLPTGQPLVVTGTLSIPDLEGPDLEGPELDGMKLDGAEIRLAGTAGSASQALELDESTGEASFRLEVTPPGPGRFLLDLEIVQDDQVSLVGQVDTDVSETRPPALLWLERAPSFETRHFKQWLASAGGEIALRTTVSRDRFRYEFHNLEQSDLSRLTADRLASFDLVVVDSTVWESLDRTERDAIEQAVAAGTLGLVLRLNLQDGALDQVPFRVTVRRIEDLDQLMVRPVDGADPPAPIAIPPFELTDYGTPLFKDSSGRILALRRRLGRGAVAVTAMTGTYRWVIEGRADAHRSYWRSLLEAVAPPDQSPRWLTPAGPVLSHEPLVVTLAGELSAPSYLVEPEGNRVALPLRQHPTRPDRFSTTIRPRLAGWHQLVTGSATASFYAVEPSTWTSWRLQRRRDATALAAAELGSAGAAHLDASPPWLRLIALAVLLSALAFLWIDERRGVRTAGPDGSSYG